MSRLGPTLLKDRIPQNCGWTRKDGECGRKKRAIYGRECVYCDMFTKKLTLQKSVARPCRGRQQKAV